MFGKSRLSLITACCGIAWAATSISFAQPIDPATARGTYSGGGVTLKGADLRRIAAGGSIEGMSPESDASPRGGGTGNVLLVECDGAYGYSTIQGAIDAAADGDVVVVLPNDCAEDGHWHENIDFLGKAIRVQSANPADEGIVDATVIDGSAAGPVVLFGQDEGRDSVIDGLTIVNGAYNDTYLPITHGGAGGGVSVVSTGPTIRRCTIQENDGRDGGGIELRGLGSPLIERCRIQDNAAVGIQQHHQWYPSFPVISDCYIARNSGGAVRLTGEEESTSLLSHCIIEGHEDAQYFVVGGAMVIEDCLFQDNHSSGFIVSGGSPMRRCTFENNSATAIIRSFDTLPAMASVESCNFVANSAISSVIWATHASVSYCTITGNSGMLGGCVILGGEVATFKNCLVVGNHVVRGGVIRAAASSSVIEGTTIIGNQCDETHGAVYGDMAATILRNCTIVGNRTKGLTAGVERGHIENSIVFNNRADGSDGHQAQVSQATTATFSDIQDLRYDFTLGGIPNALAGNISLDPRFVDPGHWDDMGTPGDLSDDVFVAGDYHLLADSPCIDGGDPAFVPAPDAVDIDGEPRLMSCRVDMGVDEFTQEDISVPGDFDGDGVVTIDDVPAFLAVALEPIGLGVCRADLNGDGFADGRDVAAMAGLLLGM